MSFLETDYLWYQDAGLVYGSSGDYEHRFVRVGDVKILRLKFKTDGVVYDLGVVDNKQTGSKDPAGETEKKEWYEKIMMMLGLIVILSLLMPFISPLLMLFFSMLWTALKTVLRIAWKVMTLPIRIITKPFRE